jgi:starvation-inducible DNA-binding protein
MNSQWVGVDETQSWEDHLCNCRDAALRTTVAVLEELLTHSIQLRELYKNARWQIPSGQFREFRQMLDEHYRQQLSLIDVIVDRIRILGGAVQVFASEFLRGPQFCRVLRGPRAVNRLLQDLFEAHELVLSAARPHDSNDDHHWVRDFAVGQVVLTNNQQCELINGILLSNEPEQRFRQSDV